MSRSLCFPRVLTLSLTLSLIPALSLLVGNSAQAEEPLLKEGDLIAIYGDSITEAKKYSVLMEDYFLMCQPAPKLQALQFGWSGERAVGMLPRMEAENLPFGANVATTCYGMNDGGYKAINKSTQNEYRAATAGIVDKLKAAGYRTIVIGAPGVVDTFTYKRSGGAKGYNPTLADLGRIGQEVAAEKGVNFADVHGVMLEAMTKAKAKYGEEFPVAGGDGVHPGSNGHLAMAYAFLKALGCSGEIGTITWDAKSGQAQATEGHQVLSASATGLEIESTRYPFCFFGDPDVQESTRNMEQFIPFNDELNRYLLVVRNAPKEGAKITWGTWSKDFTFEQLKNGINLADEFLDNPFSKPFEKVERVIKEQQNYEMQAVKSLLNGLSKWKTLVPEAKLDSEDLTKKVVARDVDLRAKSVAAVQPVKHRLTLSAIGATSEPVTTAPAAASAP